jgi:signal transduction histidine kinase
VAAYVALLAVALTVTLVVTWLALVERYDDDVEAALAQEVEEVRQLAAGVDPSTGEPFGEDVDAIFSYFLRRNVPSDDEAYYTYIDGRFHLASFDAPIELTSDLDLTARWAAVQEPTWGTTTTAAGETRFLAVPVLDAERRAAGVFVVAYFPAGGRAELWRILRTAAIAGAVVLLIAGAVAWTTASRVLRPIRDLTATARGITTNDLSGRIPVEGRDELAELGTTFNDMIERLEQGVAGQRQFLDDVAHELRTPITIVQGHLELMGDDAVDRAETLAVVGDELARMNRYVDDLLLLAKADGTNFLRPEPVDLGELARSLRPKLDGLGDRRWQMDDMPAPGTAAIIADPGRLTQAVLNLAGNAVQHTAPGATIQVGVEPILVHGEAAGARLWVRDTGPGLEPGLDDRLFDRRVRGAASRSAREDGLGIGLSIVAAIARAHGGTVAAADADGGGARFTITVPAEPPAADEEMT